MVNPNQQLTSSAKFQTEIIKKSHFFAYKAAVKLGNRFQVKRIRNGIVVNSPKYASQIIDNEAVWKEIDWVGKTPKWSPVFGFRGLTPQLDTPLKSRLTTEVITKIIDLINISIADMFEELAEDLSINTEVDLVDVVNQLSFKVVKTLTGTDIQYSSTFLEDESHFSNVIDQLKLGAESPNGRERRKWGLMHVSEMADYILSSYACGVGESTVPAILKKAGFTREEARDVLIHTSLFFIERSSVIPRMLLAVIQEGRQPLPTSDDETSFNDLYSALLRTIIATPSLVLEADVDTTIDNLPIAQGEKVILNILIAASKPGSEEVQDYTFMGRENILTQQLLRSLVAQMISIIARFPVTARSYTIARKGLIGNLAELTVKPVSSR